MAKIGRNNPCPCGGGKKYKHCHGALIAEVGPTPSRVRMERRHTYPAVGNCIYCGASGPDQKLSDEHVIAEALGGMLLLPKASCDRCGGLTSEPELHCSRKLYAVIRRQLRFPSKRGNKTRPVTFKATLDGVEREIPANDYPGLLFSFAPAMPGILTGAEPQEGFAGRVAIHTLSDFGKRLNSLRAKYRAKEVKLHTEGDAEWLARMLAKVAHAYATAELGHGNFKPLLLDIIMDKPDAYLSHYVGGAKDPHPRGNDLHEISIDRTLGGGCYVVVRIQLFADREMPVHYVVAGECLEDRKAA